MVSALSVFFFFFNDTATTEIYTLSLHDALPISSMAYSGQCDPTAWRNVIGGTPAPSAAASCAPGGTCRAGCRPDRPRAAASAQRHSRPGLERHPAGTAAPR